MKVASTFWFYENKIRAIRFNSVGDLRSVAGSVELNTQEGFGTALATTVVLLYVDFQTFAWLLDGIVKSTSGRTNLKRVEFGEGSATLYSDAILGTLQLDASKPPCVNLLYLSLAVFGEDAMKYRATRVAFHYLDLLVEKFSTIRDLIYGGETG